MRSCRDISVLVSQGLDKKLSLSERVSTTLHLALCSRCRNFQKQSQFLRKTAQHYTERLQKHFGHKP